MTDILCRWLNEEVRLDPKLTNSSFAEQFSNGFLFGEVLHKHGLQDDFAHFSKGMSSEAKLNNFMRLEPTFRLLDIPFNINMAHDIMTERQGVATRLMYQLFVALNRKKQLQLTGQSLECMRPSGKVKLERIETGIFQERLKHQTPRQIDLNFEDLIQKFQERQRQHEQLVAREKETEEERIQLERKEACHRALEKSQQVRERQTQMYAKLKPLSPGKAGGRKPTPGKKATRAELLTVERDVGRSRAVANEMRESINAFEASIHTRASLPTSLGEPHPLSTGQDKSQTTPLKMVTTADPSAEYVSQIKRRVEDDTAARKEREKRRRKVLVEQMEALRQEEEARREKVLVERLMRQCQQERRIATQLMHIRKEKDTIRNNRILRQKQFEEQRLREFEEALNREAELARQEEEEKRARLKHHLSLHRQYLSNKAKQHYHKNYQLCHQIILQLVDFTTKMAEYREVTQGMVPAKIVRDWKTLFIAGRPLYEDSDGGSEGGEGGEVQSSVTSSTASCPSHQADSQQLLDDADLLEYRNVLCDWCPPESLSGQLPRPPNPILSHVVYHLLDLVDPPQPPPAPPSFPHFLLKASFVGKPFTGKSTSLQSLAEAAGVYVLSVDQLLSKAVETFLSEKNTLEKQISSSLDVPVIPGDSESPVTPTITVQPSSSVAVVASPVVPSQSEGKGEVERRVENMKVEGDENAKVEGEEKAEPQEQKEGGSVEVLMTQLSPLAALGFKAHSSMVSGEGVEDTTTIEIIAEKLRSLPDGSAWVLESFPTTLQQAKMLASVLAGQAKPLPQLSREFVLLEEPKDREEELHAVSGLDLVVHFSASTEVVLERASQQGSGSSPEDSKLDQVQHRVLSFDESWPELRRWYQQFRNLSTVNANQDLESLCSAVQQRIQEAINKAKQSAAMKRIGGVPDGFRAQGSMIDLSSISMSRIPRHGTFPPFPLRRSRPTSAGSPNHSLRATPRKTKKEATSPQREKLESQDSDVFILTASNVEPGSAEWQYCSLPLGEELARGLAGKWPGIENTYLRTLTGVFVMLRSEREAICQYFYLRRNEIVCYLGRPDHKQEFVSQWQQNYNAISTHLRSEDVMKAELHHRVDDLCDKLWDICDHRREEVEGERGRIVDDQWLDDHIGLLSNHYITLMQVELDKFQDSLLLLQDYYAGMEGKALDQLPRMGRIPLIELGVTAKQELPPSATSSMQSVGQGEKEGSGDTTQAESPKRKIPLLPRQTPGEPTEEKGAKKKGGGPPSPPPAEDLSALELDQQLVVHAYNTAMTTVTSLMSPGLKALDSAIAEANKPPTAKTPTPQPEKKEEKGGKGGKDAKKDKAKGKGSPVKGGKASPVKGGKGAAPPPEPPPETPTHKTLSPQEVARRQQLLCMWREHKAVIQHEETTVKLRLQLIKTKALELIGNLKAKGKSMHEDIEQWIGQCYKQEVDCVNDLAQVLRQAIENEEVLMYELELPGPAFRIQQSMLMFEPSPPPAPPSPFETAPPDQLTVHQILSLHLQLMSIAPSGFMLTQRFTNTLLSMSNKALGDSVLPESWRGMTREQVERLCEALYGVEVDYADWRKFVVCVAQPSSLPSSQQLVEAVQGFVAVGGVGRKVTREEYMGVKTWVTAETATEGFNRPQKLKEAFFEIFADPKTEQLNYKKMLLYFCMDPNPREGLFKALSVAVGEQVTSQQEISPQQIVLLEDFYQVLMHGVYSNTNGAQGSERAETSFISMEHLLKVFIRLSPGNPNEAPLGALLSDPEVQEYLNLCSNYYLPDLSALIIPPEHTDGE